MYLSIICWTRIGTLRPDRVRSMPQSVSFIVPWRGFRGLASASIHPSGKRLGIATYVLTIDTLGAQFMTPPGDRKFSCPSIQGFLSARAEFTSNEKMHYICRADVNTIALQSVSIGELLISICSPFCAQRVFCACGNRALTICRWVKTRGRLNV